MVSNSVTRRSLLGGIAAGAVFAAAGGPAFALTTDQARTLVDKLVGEINAVINSGKSESRMFGDFERIFAKYADVSAIARYALGVDARSASASQLSAFTKTFQTYISRKYGRRFREFIGGKIIVENARPLKSYYEVKTTAHLQGQAPFEVVFHVSDKSGRDLFFNIFIEGVNMLLTEREEIGAMLDKRKGNLDQLIADLRAAS